MAEDNIHLAIFKEEDLDTASDAIAKLREIGIPDHDMTVLSGIPYSDKILGRPLSWTRIIQVAIGGAVTGFLLSVFLTFGTVLWYPQRVGGQPIYAIPTSFVVIFDYLRRRIMGMPPFPPTEPFVLETPPVSGSEKVAA